jgi:hypothetical protein
MLQPMQQPAASPTPSPNFAGMLAAFVEPGQKRPPARDLDGLEDDVATLSYERALRAHARYRAPEASDRALTQLAQAEAETVSIFEVLPDLNAGERPAIVEATFAVSAEDREPVVEALPAFDRNLKSASITIRMSKAECAQLRTRAAEAGLTMSAYLRSCTFEAESLRALVKDTLAQLRTEPSENDQDATPVAGGRWFGWLRRLWPNGSGRQQIARA